MAKRARQFGTGGVRVTLRSQGMLNTARKAKAEGLKAKYPIEKTYFLMAWELQNAIVDVLDKAIDARGREQRGETLQDAIKSDQNRKVRPSGFTVGYLDRIRPVNLYYRALEFDSGRPDMIRYGVWFNKEGEKVSASGPPQIDPRLMLLRTEGPRHDSGEFHSYRGAMELARSRGHHRGGRRVGQLMRIRPPTPYHYFQKGAEAWREELGHAEIVALFAENMRVDVPTLGHLLFAGFGMTPGPGAFSGRYSKGSKVPPGRFTVPVKKSRR